MPRPLQVDLSPSDLESSVRVTCDVGYLCANFSLPRPLCSQLRPNVHDRQIDVRHTSSLNAPYPGAGHNNLTALHLNTERAISGTDTSAKANDHTEQLLLNNRWVNHTHYCGYVLDRPT